MRRADLIKAARAFSLQDLRKMVNNRIISENTNFLDHNKSEMTWWYVTIQSRIWSHLRETNFRVAVTNANLFRSWVDGMENMHLNCADGNSRLDPFKKIGRCLLKRFNWQCVFDSYTDLPNHITHNDFMSHHCRLARLWQNSQFFGNIPPPTLLTTASSHTSLTIELHITTIALTKWRYIGQDYNYWNQWKGSVYQSSLH